MAPAMIDPPPSNTVCVMDASGRLGSGLVDRLLRQGYTVHAATQKQGELRPAISDPSMDKRRLKVFSSDPFDYQSIIDALKGCSGLFYAFEPPPEDQATCDPGDGGAGFALQEYMAEVEARAAHNVLEACAQVETIDKVVFASSVTAVIWRDDRASSESDFNETHWSNVNLCRKYKLWHGLSKTLAEKAAWALAMDRGVNMVSVNAGLLLGGPDLSITDPYLKGAAEMYEDGLLVTVDLDYLIDAHICVWEDGSTYGRYLCFNHTITQQEDAVKLAQMLAPGTAPPPPSYDRDTKIIQGRISNKKMNKLMVDFV